MDTAEQKKHKPRYILWLLWIIANTTAFVVAIPLSAFVTNGISPNGDVYLTFVISGLLIGICFGLAQWIVLRQLIQKSGSWLLATVIGLSIGDVLGTITRNAALQITTGLIAACLGSAMIGLLLGVAQWIILRRHVAKAGVWILATIVADIGGTVVPLANNSGIVLYYLEAGAVFGIITGGAMVFLLK